MVNRQREEDVGLLGKNTGFLGKMNGLFEGSLSFLSQSLGVVLTSSLLS